MPRDTDLAYLAGIIDADGYVTATINDKPNCFWVGPSIGITGSRREPHDLAGEIFGGRVSEHQPTRERGHHRMQFHWQRQGRSAVPVLEALLPFLRVKLEQAHLVLLLQSQIEEIGRPSDGDDFAPWAPAGWDHRPTLLIAVEEIRALNARRGQPGRFAAGRELDGVTHDEYPRAVTA
jgi:hypothetical protein